MAAGIGLRWLGGMAVLFILALAFAPLAEAEGVPPLSLTFSVASGGSGAAVRVAGYGDLSYPRIVVDRGPDSPYRGTVYVIGLEGFTECAMIVVIRSFNGGRSFEAPRRTDPLCATGPWLFVTVNRTGTLLAAGVGPVIARSQNAGLNWTTVATLGNVNATASLTVDLETDTVYATWIARDAPGRPIPGPILLSVSRDGGGNWTAPREILPSETLGTRPQVAARADVVVVSFATEDATAVRAIASADGGDTWGAVVPVGPPDPCNAPRDPSIALSASGVFAVSWTAMTGSQGCSARWGASTEVWVAISRDRGGTFSAPVRAGGPPAWIGASLGGAISFDDASALYVAWHSIAEGWTGTVYAASSPDLATFETGSITLQLQENGGNSTAQENLAAGLNGTVYMVWPVFHQYGVNDSALGIYVRAIVGEASGEVVVNENPGSPMTIEVRNPSRNETRALVAWNGSRVTIPDLPPATYEVKLRAGNASGLAGTMSVRPWSVTSFSLVVGAGGGSGIPTVLVAGAVAGTAIVAAAIAVLRRRSKREGGKHP